MTDEAVGEVIVAALVVARLRYGDDQRLGQLLPDLLAIVLSLLQSLPLFRVLSARKGRPPLQEISLH
ncbi:hypothetical protein DPMN_009056 [Dreissena polymorpha]|uniref:Uncharacterized protein n=1 Tax=Dreissena polymorpha TaxID=45954 RepID=A0A9D4MZC2_DREPO|nr:hypothetical protein DPMN_009056 [Dreissena polymorpha]